MPKRVSREDIKQTLHYFRNSPSYKQVKALILLGYSSGLRAHELYQLRPNDLHLETRTVYVNHKPSSDQTTKTGLSRVSFFDKRAQIALYDHLNALERNRKIKHIFGKTKLVRLFRSAPISVKDLRKAFSQEWDKRNGSFAVKERLLGHSLNRVDFQHYSYLDEGDLKQVYEKVMV